jgi:hypothetical protein
VAERANTKVGSIRRSFSSTTSLLRASRASLAEAECAANPCVRYAAAHLAALRAAAAVVAARAEPSDEFRRRPRSVWVLLVKVAPALREWATFFAEGARKRAAAEAGLSRVVTAREADDVLRDAERFVALVEATLDLPYQPPLSLPWAS